MQLYVNDHQQIIDGVIKAFMLAEEIMIPIMVCYDGYLLSHTYMPFDVPSQDQVDAFLPPYKPAYALDPASPANLNTVTMPDVRPDTKGRTAHGYMEIRYLLHEDLMKALDVMRSVETRFKEHFGRGGDPFYETYRCEDARFIAVSLGSLSYHLREVIDRLRDEGVKAGIMSIHLYRPFPAEAVSQALADSDGVIVFEKALSYGYEGALCSDIKAALYPSNGSKKKRPFIHNYILGLGGREIKTAQLYEAMQNSCVRGTKIDSAPQWIGLKI
jgi:pyruvate ferredoxin oxidoreductase alpha subunit